MDMIIKIELTDDTNGKFSGTATNIEDAEVLFNDVKAIAMKFDPNHINSGKGSNLQHER